MPTFCVIQCMNGYFLHNGIMISPSCDKVLTRAYQYNIILGEMKGKGIRAVDVNVVVAKNVRRIRESKKLTLDEAAAATGVSRSMLAQIERGSVNPTISILWKIASGYKVSFSKLLQETDEGTYVRKVEICEPLKDDAGRFLSYPAFTFSDKRPFETYRLILRPEAFSQNDGHMPGTEEYVTVFSGDVEICAGGRCYPVHAGESIYLRADGPHTYRNLGATDAQLSMMIYYEEKKE